MKVSGDVGHTAAADEAITGVNLCGLSQGLWLTEYNSNLALAYLQGQEHSIG